MVLDAEGLWFPPVTPDEKRSSYPPTGRQSSARAGHIWVTPSRPLTARPMAYLAQPVVSLTDRVFLGSLVARVSFESVAALLEEQAPGEQGRAHLVMPAGSY